MKTALLLAQRNALHHLHRSHKGDTMITFAYPTNTDLDPAPNWQIQRQLDTALAQARIEEAATADQHTPGPWAMEQPYGEPGTYISRPDTTELIAKLYTPDNPRETQPNARLIAAAPDLLAALRIIDRYAAAIEANPHTGLDWEFRNALGPVRAAIAKASGEEVK